MSIIDTTREHDVLQALEILARERAMSLSPREWRHRITGYGYAIAETPEGQVVTRLPRGEALCELPATLH